MSARMSPAEKAKRARARQVAKIDLNCRRHWMRLSTELFGKLAACRSLASGKNTRGNIAERVGADAAPNYLLHYQRMAALTPRDVRRLLAQLKPGRS